jgi:hypothetical protein
MNMTEEVLAEMFKWIKEQARKEEARHGELKRELSAAKTDLRIAHADCARLNTELDRKRRESNREIEGVRRKLDQVRRESSLEIDRMRQEMCRKRDNLIRAIFVIGF